MNFVEENIAPLRIALKDDNSQDEYVHVDAVREVPYDRGSQFVMSFWGECGHKFDMTFLTHKGNTFAHIDNVKEEKSVDLEWT